VEGSTLEVMQRVRDEVLEVIRSGG
jgi:hypothetical protein